MSSSLNIIEQQTSAEEFLQFDERDPCYTWLYPLRLGSLDPARIWESESSIRYSNQITLYVHVPYCRFICSMCPFTHVPLGKRDLSSYVEAVIREIQFYSKHASLNGLQATSVYFGGGTASSLTPRQAERILDALKDAVPFSDHCQCTLECHPRTVDKSYLTQIAHAGFNRVSFGIQSFNQANIASLKLHQDVSQSREILGHALDAGFETVAADIMYRYPHQTTADVINDFQAAIEVGVQGLSAYALDADLREMEVVSQSQPLVASEREMFYAVHDLLHGEGFVHVAQPDYAKPGHENAQLYDLWGAPQAQNLGFGAGAFSEFFNGYTWCNIHDPNQYIETVESDNIPLLIGQRHSLDDSMTRYPALGARCLEVPYAPFEEAFDVNFADLFRWEISRLSGLGWIKAEDEKFSVTRDGKFFIDNISKTFFNPANRGKPQLWGVNLGNVRPDIYRSMAEVLRSEE